MGEDETDSLCSELKKSEIQVVQTRGGHHFGGDYRSIAEIILKETE